MSKNDYCLTQSNRFVPKIESTPKQEQKPKKKIIKKSNYDTAEPVYDDVIMNKIAKLKNKEETQDNGNTRYLNSQWTIWVHRNDCTDWTLSGFKDIYVINNISTFWSFFNNFHNINKEENQFFIFRDKIKPIWEDNNNRNGGICSIKLDCYDKNNKIDVGCEVMICFCLLMMNETLLLNNQEINGISYSIKNRSVLIKIWCKDVKSNIEDQLPKNLITKISNIIKNTTSFKKYENNVNIRYNPIKPEYEN